MNILTKRQLKAKAIRHKKSSFIPLAHTLIHIFVKNTLFKVFCDHRNDFCLRDISYSYV